MFHGGNFEISWSDNFSENVWIEGMSCSDTKFLSQSRVKPIILLSTDSVRIGAEEESFETFLVKANIEWRIEKNESWLEVYPMTGADSAEVRVPAIQSDFFIHSDIEIVSMQGQMIYRNTMKGSLHQIDLSSFPKGTYFITIRSNEFIATKKIIKM